MPDRPLEGRVAVVTGATGSAGPHVVAELARRGATVAAVGRDRTSLDALAAGAGEGGRVEAFEADVARLADARRLAGAVIERLGRADVVVHLVGGWRGNGPLAEVTDEE